MQVLHSEKIESYNCSMNGVNFFKRILTSHHVLVSQKDCLCRLDFVWKFPLGGSHGNKLEYLPPPPNSATQLKENS